MSTILEYLYYITLALSFLLSIYYYRKLKGEPIKLLPWFLGYTIFTEIVANMLWQVFGMYNVWWYNIYANVSILFFIYIFYHYIKNKRTRTFLILGAVVFQVYYFINFLFLSENYNIYQSFPRAFGNIIVIIAVFLFLIELFQSDKILFLTKYFIFWFSLGLLFNLAVLLPITISDFFLGREEFINVKTYHFTNIIRHIVNIIYYGSIGLGLIWSKKPYHT